MSCFTIVCKKAHVSMTDSNNTHFFKASQWEWFSVTMLSAKIKVNVTQSHICLLKDLSWPFKADSNHRKLSSSALYVVMFLWPKATFNRAALTSACEIQHSVKTKIIINSRYLALALLDTLLNIKWLYVSDSKTHL